MAHFPRPITSASSMAYSQDNLVLPPLTQRQPSKRRLASRGFVQRRFLQRPRSSVPDLDHAHGVAEPSPFREIAGVRACDEVVEYNPCTSFAAVHEFAPQQGRQAHMPKPVCAWCRLSLLSATSSSNRSIAPKACRCSIVTLPRGRLSRPPYNTFSGP